MMRIKDPLTPCQEHRLQWECVCVCVCLLIVPICVCFLLTLVFVYFLCLVCVFFLVKSCSLGVEGAQTGEALPR